jgi:hypothetical protein
MRTARRAESHLMGEAEVVFLEGPTGAATGDTLLTVKSLSDSGVKQLARGYWMPPKKANGERFGYTILAVDSRIKYGSIELKVIHPPLHTTMPRHITVALYLSKVQHRTVS